MSAQIFWSGVLFRRWKHKQPPTLADIIQRRRLQRLWRTWDAAGGIASAIMGSLVRY